MNLVIAMVIGLIFGVSFGWCWGYHTRPEPRRVWACARCDDTALREEAVRFNAVLAGLDFDPPPIPDTLCCLRWWESAGAEHGQQCTRKDQTL